jgi:hypothetical protein
VGDITDKRMQELVDTLDCPDPDEVASMIDEIRRRRAASVCKYCDMGHREHRAGCPMLILCDADRESLAALRYQATEYGFGPTKDNEPEDETEGWRWRCIEMLNRLIGTSTTRGPIDVLRSGIIADPAPTAVECEENRRANRACPSNCRQRRHHSGDQ